MIRFAAHMNPSGVHSGEVAVQDGRAISLQQWLSSIAFVLAGNVICKFFSLIQMCAYETVSLG